MISLPFTGHVNPTLGMAKELVNAGHDVSFVLTENWRDIISKTGAKFVPYNDFPVKPTSLELRQQSFKAAYETAYHIGAQYDVVVYEMLFFLGKNLADRLGKPSVRLFSTFALDSEMLNRFVYTGGPLMGLFKSKSIRKWITNMLLGSNISIGNKDLLSEIVNNTPDLNFVFTTKDFQVYNERFPEDKYKFIGPSISARDNNSTLNLQGLTSPLVYISLGSIINNAKGFYKKCIDAFRNENVSVIMSVGNKIKIEELGEVPANFHIQSYVPQLQVLEHADLFITHGGMNSVNEALYYGVPMVVFPLATDQPTIADRIVELNLGCKFSDKSPSVKDIRQNVLSVLVDKSIRAQTKKFRSFSQQSKGIPYAVKEIEKYVGERQRQREQIRCLECR